MIPLHYIPFTLTLVHQNPMWPITIKFKHNNDMVNEKISHLQTSGGTVNRVTVPTRVSGLYKISSQFKNNSTDVVQQQRLLNAWITRKHRAFFNNNAIEGFSSHLSIKYSFKEV